MSKLIGYDAWNGPELPRGLCGACQRPGEKTTYDPDYGWYLCVECRERREIEVEERED